MGNDLKELDNRVMLSGKALLATISTMGDFGDLASNVLQRYGIGEIDENLTYPYELRSLIHEATLKRYGPDALRAFGFAHGENFKSLFEDIYRQRDNMGANFASNDYKINVAALGKLMALYVRLNDKFTKSVASSPDTIFHNTMERLSDTEFKWKSFNAMKHYQSPFLEGVLTYQFTNVFGEYWKITIVYNQSESALINGFAEECFTISFKKRLNFKSADVLISNTRSKYREKLFKSVLVELDSLSHQLGKYLPPQIHDAIFSGEYDTEIKTRRKKLTIFFSDIKNFTSTSEGLQPEDLTKYLNEYFSEMTQIALDQGATIDKYIGDAMMVFFGDPESKGEKEDARACVEMALKMQERMEELQEKWRNEGFADPFQVRMGINTGYCNVGNFGSDQRLTYTIIGGEVNVAQRLEGNADSNGILMSYETYAHAQDMIEVEEREAIKMKGISREIKVFSVVERKSKVGNEKKEIKKKPTKRELSEIERIKKDVALVKNNVEDLNKKMDAVLKKL